MKRTALASALLVLLALPSLAKNTSYPRPSLTEPMRERDDSLSLDEYETLGVPSADHAWRPDEYSMAMKIFTAQISKRPGVLPRKHSKKSGLLFTRLVADENFAVITNEAFGSDDRGMLVMQFMEMIEDLALSYIGAMRTDPSYSAELVEIYAFRMRFMIAANRWATTAGLSSYADDRSIADDRGLDEVIAKGTVDAVMLSATMVANPTALPTSARATLARHLDESLPALLLSMPDSIQGRVASFVSETARRERSPEVGGILAGLSRRLPESRGGESVFPAEAFGDGDPAEEPTGVPPRGETRRHGSENAPPIPPWLDRP